MIFVLAGAAPGCVHDSLGEVHDQRGNGLFSIKGLLAVDGMVADRVLKVDVIALDGL